jgi:hypothetical protein
VVLALGGLVTARNWQRLHSASPAAVAFVSEAFDFSNRKVIGKMAGAILPSEAAVRTESYVVRIYRRGRRAGGLLVGVVEAVSGGWQKPFRSVQELASIFATPRVRATAKPRTQAVEEDPE